MWLTPALIPALTADIPDWSIYCSILTHDNHILVVARYADFVPYGSIGAPLFPLEDPTSLERARQEVLRVVALGKRMQRVDHAMERVALTCTLAMVGVAVWVAVFFL